MATSAGCEALDLRADVGTTSALALPRRSLAGSERLTMPYTSKASGRSRPLLPDHAELAASGSEQAERDAARARRSIRRAR